MGVELIHDERADLFVVHATDNRVLQGVAEWPMAHIVQQDGQAGPPVFFFCDDDAFFAQGVQGFLHQKHRTNSMVKPVVNGPGVDEVAEAELADSAQPLDPRVVHDFGEVSVTQLYEPVNGVVEQLGTCSHGRNLGSFFAWPPLSQNNCEQKALNHS